jgi:hypothetical protein
MPTVTLKKPIILGERQFAVIDIDEPTLGGIAAHEMSLASTGSETAALMAMLVAETGWPMEAVRKIKASEMEALAEILLPFAKGEPSGESGEASPPMSLTS